MIFELLKSELETLLFTTDEKCSSSIFLLGYISCKEFVVRSKPCGDDRKNIQLYRLEMAPLLNEYY